MTLVCQTFEENFCSIPSDLLSQPSLSPFDKGSPGVFGVTSGKHTAQDAVPCSRPEQGAQGERQQLPPQGLLGYLIWIREVSHKSLPSPGVILSRGRRQQKKVMKNED